jgi:signal transduction histidine kinase
VHVTTTIDDGHAELRVTDTGIGIPPAFLPFVFDKFRQADGSFTRQHGGLGLGLAIARHLIELHGGSIEARSAGEGAGATFVVRLPLPSLSPADDQ